MNTHNLLSNITVITYCENKINYIVIFGLNQLLKINTINRIYLLIKFKIFLFVFDFILRLIPNKENNFELTSELQNDYKDILNRHKLK